MTGNTVLQRFEITERLGAGGFGTVYRAWDNRLERDVAVKVIETGAGSGERVQREAQAAARLNHPGIVTLFEYDFQKGRAYLVSELVEGSTVRQLIDCDGLSDRDIAEVGADVCEALDHAHSRGVVHRDLKPANLIVERRGGAAKLMDFGIARLTDAEDLTMTGDVLGTLAYMSPEQAEGRKVGTPGDVYSLCLTLYEAWSGQNPRRRSTPTATARAFDQQLPSLLKYRPDLPPELIDVIDCGLDQEPEYRPTIENLGTVLEDSLNWLDDSAPEGGHFEGKADGSSSLSDFARIGAAAGTAAMVATVLIVSGEADPASVLVLSVTAALTSLLNARLGFIVAGAVSAAWLAIAANMAGAALVMGLLTVPAGIFSRGTGRTLAISPLGPLFGTLGLAPFLPFLAAAADGWRERAMVASCGLAWTALAEAVTGRSLLFGSIPKASSGWEDSAGSAVSGLLVPTLATPAFLLSLAVWIAVAVGVGAIVSMARGRRRAPEHDDWTGEGPSPLSPAAAGQSPFLP